MISKENLEQQGWIEDTGIHYTGSMIKKLGRSTYRVYVGEGNQLGKIFIGVFVPRDPEEIWSQSMQSPLFNGKCPNMETFDKIFELVHTHP